MTSSRLRPLLPLKKSILSMTSQPSAARLASLSGHLQSSQATLNHNRSFTNTVNMQSPGNNAEFRLEKLFNVENKVAIVSGGGTGIGLMATQGSLHSST